MKKLCTHQIENHKKIYAVNELINEFVHENNFRSIK